MEPIDYFRLLRRRWRLLAACIVIAATAAWLTAPSGDSDEPIRFRADTTIVRDVRAEAPQALATVQLFVRSGEVPRRVADRIGFEGNPVILARSLEVEADETTGTLTVTAVANSRTEAAELANVVVDETLAFMGEQAQAEQQRALDQARAEVTRLQSEIDDLDEEIDTATAAGEDTDLLEAQRDAKLTLYGSALAQQEQLAVQNPPTAGYLVLEPATEELASPADAGITAPRSKPLRAAIGVLLGLLLGVGVILVVERIDPRIFTREQAEEAFGLPVVAEVPDVRSKHKRAVLMVDTPGSAAAEAHRTLRASLLLMPTLVLTASGAWRREPEGDQQTDPHVVLVTSPEPGDGKTTTVANLAAGFAEAGRSVLVLGCDFRRPEIHRFLGASGQPGLAEVLTGEYADLTEVIQSTTVPNVRLVASGGALSNFGDVASTGRQVLTRSRAHADIVLIDTAPVLATNDATELIPAVDSVVVVCRAGKTTREAARRTSDLLARLAAPIVGVVLVGVRSKDAAYYGRYYTNASTNGAAAGDGRRARRRERRRAKT